MNGEGSSTRLWSGALLLLLLLDVLQIYGIWAHGALRQQDFFGLWSFAQFVQTHPVASLYNPDELNAYQHHLDPDFTDFYPFPYPPPFLLALWPLGKLGYWPARLLWTIVTGAVFAWALWRVLPCWRRIGLALVFLAPACVDNILTGETGFLTSALMLGAVLARGPWVPGLCLGLLLLKPQLAVLIPFAFAGRRDWRAILLAALTSVLLVALSCLAFSPKPWGIWFQALRQYQMLEGQNAAYLAPLMTSLTATATTLGLPRLALGIVSATGLILGVCVCVWVFLKGERNLAAAALFAGTFAVTPHAFFYDAPVMIFSVLVLWWRTSFARADLALGLLTLLFPLEAGGPLTHITPAGPLYLLLFLRLSWRAVALR